MTDRAAFITAIVATYEKELDAIPRRLLSKKTRGDLVAGFTDGVRSTLAQLDGQKKPLVSLMGNAHADVEPTAAAVDDDDDVDYQCECSWVGGDPDEPPENGKAFPTCPACLARDGKLVEVKPMGATP
jgi:hypothetical protein